MLHGKKANSPRTLYIKLNKPTDARENKINSALTLWNNTKAGGNSPPWWKDNTRIFSLSHIPRIIYTLYLFEHQQGKDQSRSEASVNVYIWGNLILTHLSGYDNRWYRRYSGSNVCWIMKKDADFACWGTNGWWTDQEVTEFI